MNREDIIRMAREAGAYPAANTDRALLLLSESHLERFAALVAAAELEACETIADAEASSWGGFDSGFTASVNIAAAIRARGQA